MMSLLWYYRPEHTKQGRQKDDMPDELFASKHRDVNSVACIDDRCYVLTFNEYCRSVFHQMMTPRHVFRFNYFLYSLEVRRCRNILDYT
jgi:hypothetical protein